MLDKRVIDLEIKFSHQDDLVNELNLIVAKQQLVIEKLEHQMSLLSESVNSSTSQGHSLADDKPPHY